MPLANLSVVVDANSIADASDQIIATKPSILLIDCNYSSFCLRSIRQVETLSPSTKCLLLADDGGEKFAAQAALSGAWGVVSKGTDPVVMQNAIQKLASGEMWFSQATMANAVQALIRQEPPEESTLERLTPRETEVLTLLARGYHNKQIARRLFLSESTIRTYLEAIYRKTRARSRVEAALRYYERTEFPIPRAGSSS